MGVLARPTASLRLVLLLVVSACGDGTSPNLDGGFSVLEGAHDGVARVGSEVRVAFRATDDAGRPSVGLAVSFVVVEGGGHVFAGVSVTNAQGEAREVWTIESTGNQVLEARAIDPITGDPQVLGRLELLSRPGMAVRAIFTDTTVAAVGQPYDVRDAVAWMDDHLNYFFDSTLAVISLPDGVERDGYQLTADHEVIGEAVLRLDTLTARLTLAFVTDVRQGTWRVRATCTDPASPDGPAVYDATTIGTAYTIMPFDILHLSDAQYRGSPWPPGHRLFLGMEGTATYKGMTHPLHVVIDQGWPIWVEHRPGYIDLEASESMFFSGTVPPELGRLPTTGAGPTWEGHYQMPVIGGVQKVSTFCSFLAANMPPDLSLQLRTATDVQVSISPNE